MKFTEKNTKDFYDLHDGFYKTFWDQEGSHHWGIFENFSGEYKLGIFNKAIIHSNELIAEAAQLKPDSIVLDVCCGNGSTALWIAEHFGCRVVGIDISSVRVNNACKMLSSRSKSLRERIAFYTMSITANQLESEVFTHVLSQSSLYHVHEKIESLKQIYRLLQKGGVFVFDDLYRNAERITPAAQKYVYDRMLFETDFNFITYQKTLEELGFKVLKAQDLTPHLLISYRFLTKLAGKEESIRKDPSYKEFSLAYAKVAQIIENGELGWGMFSCQKPHHEAACV